jgi:hypothetical protein
MDNVHCSDLASAWLTPLQASFLERLFATEAGQRFYLTGGTALAAFRLHHRVSVDLDLFTLDDLALREADVLIPQLATDLDCRIGTPYRAFSLILPELQQFILALADRLLDRTRPPENHAAFA